MRGAVRRLLHLTGRGREQPFRILVRRDGATVELEPEAFRGFAFRGGEELAVVPAELAAGLPTSFGDVVVPLASGGSVRVPPRMELHEVAGYRIPVHLIRLSGSEPEEFAAIGGRHVETFGRRLGLGGEMSVLDVGCGVGRDALHLLEVLGPGGRYLGVDVAADSIEWCTTEITTRDGRFAFRHLDVRHELYNPFGTLTSTEARLPAADASIDRVTAVSLLTHLLEEEIVHFLSEFRRVLRPDGLAYATFFLYSPAAAASAARVENPWGISFSHELGQGFFVDDPTSPRGAVAFTEVALGRMLRRAGLRTVGPYLRGSWSGLHAETAGGQDGAVLARLNARRARGPRGRGR